jgi:hypothetical protein
MTDIQYKIKLISKKLKILAINYNNLRHDTIYYNLYNN